MAFTLLRRRGDLNFSREGLALSSFDPRDTVGLGFDSDSVILGVFPRVVLELSTTGLSRTEFLLILRGSRTSSLLRGEVDLLRMPDLKVNLDIFIGGIHTPDFTHKLLDL
jgi:hypothetical protein